MKLGKVTFTGEITQDTLLFKTKGFGFVLQNGTYQPGKVIRFTAKWTNMWYKKT